MLQARILVVDDIEDNLDLLEDMLVSEGCTVTRALNGPDAIQKARETDPDVILLDLMMPHMDGIAVFEILCSDKYLSRIPVILNTAYCDRDNLSQAVGRGFKHILCKPLERGRVIEEIMNCLKNTASNDYATLKADHKDVATAQDGGKPKSASQKMDSELTAAATNPALIAALRRLLTQASDLGQQLIASANALPPADRIRVRGVPAALVRLGSCGARLAIRECQVDSREDANHIEALAGAVAAMLRDVGDARDPESALLTQLQLLEERYKVLAAS